MTVLGLASAAASVFTVNLPFGFWRAGVRRFSVPWFLAVHVPVPLVIGIRLLSGLGWRPITIPFFVAAFIAGQFTGGRLRAWISSRHGRRGK
jgi:hypothetical protein